MKFLACLLVAAVVVCQVIASPVAAPAAEEVVQVTPVAEVSVPTIVREQRSYGAPAPSYGGGAPAYAPPRLSPPKSYSYQSPAPTIPCGQALVFSCAPSVAQAPCAAAPTYGGGYAQGGY